MTQPVPHVDAERRAQLEAALCLAQPPAGAAGPGAPPLRPRTDRSGAVDATAVAFNVFASLLATEGVRAALYSLLRRTDYRFISIFRFRDGMATSAAHVDREDLKVLQAPEVSDVSTYCCYVRDSGGAFVTADALRDPRTTVHPAREAVRSYCGLPILDREGVLIGTLCHYDLMPRDPAQLDLELLLQAASALSAPGIVPAYPSRPAQVPAQPKASSRRR